MEKAGLGVEVSNKKLQLLILLIFINLRSKVIDISLSLRSTKGDCHTVWCLCFMGY